MKKKIWIIILVIALIAIAGIIGIKLFTGKSQNGDNLEADLKTTLDYYTKSESTDAPFVIGYDFDETISKENDFVVKELLDKIDYRIMNVERTEDNATVTVKMEMPDALSVYKEIEQEKLTEEEIHNRLAEGIEHVDDIVIEVQLSLEKIGEHWYLALNDELSNALSGGIIDYYEEELQELFDIMMEAGEEQ